MRTFAIGDIHGCSRALAALLQMVAAKPEARLVTLGDYVDRGPDTRGVLEQLIPLHAAGRLVALRGNHEQMMLDAVADGDSFKLWLACGGVETLTSYGAVCPDADAFALIPQNHWRFLREALVDYHETDTHFFVHANAHPELPLDEQPQYILLWEKLCEPCDHFSGKVMVCGHTRMLDGLPHDLGQTVCLDTGAYNPGGWLTCADLETGRYWQANEEGEVRSGWLDED
jgi:serine/threonine protein phosphatase 1